LRLRKKKIKLDAFWSAFFGLEFNLRKFKKITWKASKKFESRLNPVVLKSKKRSKAVILKLKKRSKSLKFLRGRPFLILKKLSGSTFRVLNKFK
jgi:hypothetical protein